MSKTGVDDLNKLYNKLLVIKLHLKFPTQHYNSIFFFLIYKLRFGLRSL